jgi:hypothetical protein
MQGYFRAFNCHISIFILNNVSVLMMDYYGGLSVNHAVNLKAHINGFFVFQTLILDWQLKQKQPILADIFI